jgi:uncharacterized membrane protein YhaH (DUF805 family)
MSDDGPYSRGRSLAANFPYLHGGPVEFDEAIRQGFRNGFVYRGRASRPAYWWFVLFLVIFDFALEFIFFLINALGGGGSGASVGTVAAFILVIIFSFFTIYLDLVLLALLVRRLHDIDKSGWWVLIGFVPFAGAIILLIFTLRKGTPELNRYQP